MTRALTIKRDNSIAAKHPHLLEEWDWEKNNEIGLDPRLNTCGQSIHAHWICRKCGNKWSACIASRCKGHGCPECAKQIISSHRSKPKPGKSLFERKPELLAEWDYSKNTFSPKDVGEKSNKYAWWVCGKCGHEWKAVIASRSVGHGCPKCGRDFIGAQRSKPKQGESLADLCPHLVSEWHPTKNTIDPKDVKFSSHKKVWWKCAVCGYEWATTIHHRSIGKTTCPSCYRGRTVSFPEKAVLFYVSQLFADSLANSTPNIAELENMTFDIWIPSIRTAIEYDGEFWHDKEKAPIDQKKDSICFSNGIRMIRIREPSCHNYAVVLSTIVFDRKTSVGANSLNAVIREVLDYLCQNSISVDVDRDFLAIRELMDVSQSGKLLINHPELMNRLDDEKNGDIPLEQLIVRDNIALWWKCPKGHSYSRSLCYEHRNGVSCPECNRENARVRALTPKEGKSFQDAFPNMSSEFVEVVDPRYKDMLPISLKPQSNLLVRWKCAYCGKTWESKITHRTHRQKDVCGCRSCKTYIRFHGEDWLLRKLDEE